MTEQGYPRAQPDYPGRRGQSPIPQEPRRSGWQVLDAFDAGGDSDADVPPWAGLESVHPVRRPAAPADPGEPRRQVEPDPDRPPRRRMGPGQSRAAATRRRRSRRRLAIVVVAAVVVAAVVVAVLFLGQPTAVTGGPITSLQKGEYGSVPDACRSVPAAILRQYLGAAPKSVRPQPVQCTFTVDAKPRFRELNVVVQALQPNAGYGNGSATADARYSFAQQRALLAKPPKHTPGPPATITPVGLGDKAFIAVQVYRGLVVTNKVTVLVRYRNVLITAYLLGDVSGGFGPAPISEMQAGALAAARALLAAVQAQQAIG